MFRRTAQGLLKANIKLATVAALAFIAFPPHQAAAQRATCTRQETPFDADWRFHLGDQPGSEAASVSDTSWRKLSLPHDWAIELPFAQTNPSGGAGAFAQMGVGWYRKHLPTPAAGCDRRVYVQFDGIMANSDVWVNGHLLGHRPSGYITLRYDLTPYLNKTAGADNVIAVRADNSQQPSSRFYQGAGIYRHVHLIETPQVHFETGATVVRTPTITADAATIEVETTLHNDTAAPQTESLTAVVLDATGKEVARGTAAAAPISAGQSTTYHATLSLPHPKLWNLEAPNLYRVRVEAANGKAMGDREVVSFGVRDAHFDAATGFWLNGKNIKVRGVALHSDIGALGMAAPLSLWEHRLRAMQRMGANAVRTAHNAVAPEFLDLCDRMGILVLDEFFDQWTVGKNTYDYHLYFKDWYLTDTRETVMRDRNHPSIIAWSAGNEIHDTPHPEIAKPILAALVDEYHKADPTRPVTQALFRPNVSHDYDNGLADLLDVIGQNYRPNEILAAHDAKPTRKILGTENIHDRGTWLDVRDHPAYSGLFIWSGTDYLGESRHWPLIADASGMMDRTDFDKPDSLEREAWWNDSATHPVIHIARRVAPTPKAPTDPGYELEQFRPAPTVFADWTPANLAPHTERVEVYSNCKEVALKLNGQDLGHKPLAADLATRSWEVPFAPGALEAQCIDQPKISETLHTAGTPASVRLAIEGNTPGTGFDDVAVVRLTILDAHGVPVPNAALPVKFSVSGSATLLATDNADYTYSGVFSDPQRKTFNGRAVAFIRGTTQGTAHLKAESAGLPAATLDLPIAKH